MSKPVNPDLMPRLLLSSPECELYTREKNEHRQIARQLADIAQILLSLGVQTQRTITEAERLVLDMQLSGLSPSTRQLVNKLWEQHPNSSKMEAPIKAVQSLALVHLGVAQFLELAVTRHVRV